MSYYKVFFVVASMVSLMLTIAMTLIYHIQDELGTEKTTAISMLVGVAIGCSTFHVVFRIYLGYVTDTVRESGGCYLHMEEEDYIIIKQDTHDEMMAIIERQSFLIGRYMDQTKVRKNNGGKQELAGSPKGHQA